jgi:hypothetical protein
MTTRIELDLHGALLATGLVCPVSSDTKPGHVEILSRQVPGQEAIWLKAIDAILSHFETTPKVDVHICRRYVRSSGKLAFGWHLSLTTKPAKSLVTAVNGVIEVLKKYKATLELPEVTEEAVPQAMMVRQRRKVLAPGEHPEKPVVHPRAPAASNEPKYDGVSTGDIKIKVVQHTVDENGKVTHIDEMPLPHVHHEMNRPNAKGRGARKVG